MAANGGRLGALVPPSHESKSALSFHLVSPFGSAMLYLKSMTKTSLSDREYDISLSNEVFYASLVK